MPNALSPIRDSLSREKLAYNSIKEAILTFQFLPDQNLVENDLAAQLAISKTPVRDAILQLEKEGLITRIEFKKAYVSALTHQDMREIFDIRISLEGLATFLAAPLLTDDEKAEMQRIIHAQVTALAQSNLPEVSRLNRSFHTILIQRCPNLRLKQILANLEDHLVRYRILSNYQGGRLDKSITEHQAILDAIHDQDYTRAEQAMKHHLDSVRADLDRLNFDELANKIHETSPSIR